MKESLTVGLKYEHRYVVEQDKTVPFIYPESEELSVMPEVFATGFMVAFLELACIKCINPHLDLETEQTLGIHVNVSHEAGTPLGFEVVANVELIKVEGKKLTFQVEASDGVDIISRGVHERFVIAKDRFVDKMNKKAQSQIV